MGFLVVLFQFVPFKTVGDCRRNLKKKMSG